MRPVPKAWGQGAQVSAATWRCELGLSLSVSPRQSQQARLDVALQPMVWPLRHTWSAEPHGVHRRSPDVSAVRWGCRLQACRRGTHRSPCWGRWALGAGVPMHLCLHVAEVEAKGDTDQLSLEELMGLVNKPELVKVTGRHTPSQTVAFWLPEAEMKKMELELGTEIRLKTRGDSPFVCECLPRLPAQLCSSLLPAPAWGWQLQRCRG